jgi:hypothetical protein
MKGLLRWKRLVVFARPALKVILTIVASEFVVGATERIEEISAARHFDCCCKLKVAVR